MQKIQAFKALYDNEPMHRFGNRHIVRQGADPRPFGMIFAFSGKTKLETLLGNLEALETSIAPQHRSDLIVVHGVGLIARTADGQHRLERLSGSLDLSGVPSSTLLAIPALFKTLPLFYQILSEMLVSVPTFPVNPALYNRVVIPVDGSNVSGQVREINAKTKFKDSMSLAFLKSVVAWVRSEPSTTLKRLENDMFTSKKLSFVSMGDGDVWLYDPERWIASVAFPKIELNPGQPKIRTLASSCRIISVDDLPVLVPMAYLVGDNIEQETRDGRGG